MLICKIDQAFLKELLPDLLNIKDENSNAQQNLIGSCAAIQLKDIF